jgi:hypothetical protein
MKLLPIRNLFEVTADLRSGLRGRRREYLTILKLADHALFKMASEARARPLEGLRSLQINS